MHVTHSEATGPCRRVTPISCRRSLCKGLRETSTAWLCARPPWVHWPRAISWEEGARQVAERTPQQAEVAQLAPAPRSPGVSSGAEGLKITLAFVVSRRTTESELISGKPSMREGPAHRDLPFGQMIFPEKCQLLCDCCCYCC